MRRRDPAARGAGRHGPAQCLGDPPGDRGRPGARGGAEHGRARSAGDLFVSTIPTEVYLRLLGRRPDAGDRADPLLGADLGGLRHPPAVDPRAYWINLASLDRTACGIFLLSSLNPTIGRPGDSCVNFVTHLRGRDRPLFHAPDDELLARYRDDFRAVFGFELEPFWTHIARVPMYSPVFGRSFRNPPVRSASWENVYFAGNYRTFPSIVSTGTALGSGLETAEALLGDLGARTGAGRRRAGPSASGAMPRA